MAIEIPDRQSYLSRRDVRDVQVEIETDPREILSNRDVEKVSVYVETATPWARFESPWIRKARQQIQELVNLPENWDSAGARRIRPEVARSAFQILSHIMRYDLVLPWINPRPEGGIEFAWFTDYIDFEIEVFPDPRSPEVLYEDKRTGHLWQGEFDDPYLSEFLLNELRTELRSQ